MRFLSRYRVHVGKALITELFSIKIEGECYIIFLNKNLSVIQNVTTTPAHILVIMFATACC